jgi:hypothetical protein
LEAVTVVDHQSGIRLRAARVTIAWGVLGAAAGLCLLYSRWVFDGGGWWVCPREEEARSAGHARVCGWVAFEGERPGRLAHRAVDLWYVAVAAGLAGVGGLAGAAVGRSLPDRLRRPAAGDRWLGLAAIGTVAAALAVAGVPGEHSGSPLAWARRVLGRPSAPGDVVNLATEAVRLLALAVPIGWAAQVVIAAAGLRLAGGLALDQAADYDDVRAAEPPRAPDRGGGK